MPCSPNSERAREALGDLLLAKGDLTAAAEAFEEALKLNPGRQQTRMKLGRVLMRMGHVDKAKALRGEFLRTGEDNQDIIRAVNLEKEEKLVEAERIYRDILRRHPDNVSAMRLWARLGTRQQRHQDAEVLLKRAVRVAPDFNQAWPTSSQSNTNSRNSTRRQRVRCVSSSSTPAYPTATCCWRPRARPRDFTTTRCGLSTTPSPSIRNTSARSAAGGNVCRTVGDQAGAIAAFRSSIEANPLHAEAYWNLANLKTFRFEDSEVEDMLALVGDERIPPDGQVQLNNALGLEFEGRRDYDRAFEHIDRGNRLRRESEFYDRVENEEMADASIEVFTRQLFDANADCGDPDNAPIFIVGLPRSGSTLIEQILSSHSMVDGTHELRDLGMTVRSDRITGAFNPRYPRNLENIDDGGFRRLGGEYIRRTRRYRGARPHFTDKNPNNYVHAGLIHLILPNAKVIDARRHPLDSCLGSYKQLFAQGQPFSYDLVELGEYYLQYQRLMEHWREVLPGRVLDVRYEEVVADLEGKCGGFSSTADCLGKMRACGSTRPRGPSSPQARSRCANPYTPTSVNTWRRYEAHLGPLIEVLEPLLMQLPAEDRPADLGGPDRLRLGRALQQFLRHEAQGRRIGRADLQHGPPGSPSTPAADRGCAPSSRPAISRRRVPWAPRRWLRPCGRRGQVLDAFGFGSEAHPRDMVLMHVEASRAHAADVKSRRSA